MKAEFSMPKLKCVVSLSALGLQPFSTDEQVIGEARPFARRELPQFG